MSDLKPKDRTRIGKFLQSYRRLHDATLSTSNEIGQFCGETEIFFDNMTVMNNHMAVLEKTPGISIKSLDERWVIMDQILAKTTLFKEFFMELVNDTKPLVDGIFDFKARIKKGMDIIESGVSSQVLLKELMAMEKELLLLHGDYKTIKARFDNCQVRFKEMEALRRQLLN